jgi:hypothetical protein
MRRLTPTGIYFDRPQIHLIPMQQPAQCRALGNDPGAERFIRWPRRELPHVWALASSWIEGSGDLNDQSERRRRWLLRLWAERPLRVPLRAAHFG